MTTATEQWENALVAAWSEEPDCAPSTGMCDACGLGAVIVTVDPITGETSSRSVMTGNGAGREAPYDYNEATFEIASFTKHFTAVLMLVMELEGTVEKSTTIGELLPCDWSAASDPSVANITLSELRLHTSGLPAQPPNRADAGGGGNPFSGYTEEMLCESLLALTGLPAQGRFSYSNYAYGLLGYVLTLAVDPDAPPEFEDLLKEKVLYPLGMYNTSVTYSDAEWEAAARGCSRGIKRSEETIRIGPYGVLQGNGALRSTLVDMARHLEVELLREGELLSDDQGNYTEEQKTLYQAMSELENRKTEDACRCVSDWCEGNLCPLTNPVKETVNDAGVTLYTSGGILGNRKSGDTGGYSLRGVWSFDKSRAAFVIDTCGGCGERGTAGSAAQRLAVLLADGPPDALLNGTNSSSSTTTATTATKLADGEVQQFVGSATSHNFPSLTDIQVHVRGGPGGMATVSVASSDGAGCTSNATPVEDGWVINGNVLYGCGWGAGNPLEVAPQKRSLRILPDGSSVVLQDMGEDIHLTAAADAGGGATPETRNVDGQPQMGGNTPAGGTSSAAYRTHLANAPMLPFLVMVVVFLKLVK